MVRFQVRPSENCSLPMSYISTTTRSLDLSFNNIRHISHIAHLSHLRTVYFVQNKISHVRPEDFDGPIANALTSLELGGNKLRKIENIERLTKLEELWLGKNKIPRLEVR